MTNVWLSWMVVVPLAVVAALVAASGLARAIGRPLPRAAWIGSAIGAALFDLALAVALWFRFDPGAADAVQQVERVPWLPEWGIHFFVGVDGISLLLVLLTSYLVLAALVVSLLERRAGTRGFVVCALLLESAAIGVATSLDVFQWVFFWGLAWLPPVFLVATWGRAAAAKKFFVFVFASILLQLIAFLAIASIHADQFGVWHFAWIAPPDGSVSGLVETLIEAPATVWWRSQAVLFLAFALAFGFAAALAPLHTWVQGAHDEAPTQASILLSGVLLPLGVLGFLRFALPLFPLAANEAKFVLLALATFGIWRAALVAWAASDGGRAVAAVSLAQLSFALLGLFTFESPGLEGAVLVLLSHGLVIASLFLLFGALQRRRGTRALTALGGIAHPMPVFAFLFALALLAGAGFPGLGSFVGQFLVLLGTLRENAWLGCAALLGIIPLAGAQLRLFRRVALGPIENAENRGLIDLDWREQATLWALLLPILWIGIYPETVTSRLHHPVLDLRRTMERNAQDAVPVRAARTFGSAREPTP